jgi:hypothetical protein
LCCCGHACCCPCCGRRGSSGGCRWPWRRGLRDGRQRRAPILRVLLVLLVLLVLRLRLCILLPLAAALTVRLAAALTVRSQVCARAGLSLRPGLISLRVRLPSARLLLRWAEDLRGRERDGSHRG